MISIRIPEEMRETYDRLRGAIEPYRRLAVAFSGGVDSTLLLHVAQKVLGRENAMGIMATGQMLTPREYNKAQDIAEKFDFNLHVFEFSEYEVEGFTDNTVDRCYLCKSNLFTQLIRIAKSQGFDTQADGSTLEDETDDYRPGMIALRELGVVSPLKDIGLRKREIRTISHALGLPNWNKPSGACLATRFPYGTQIRPVRVKQVAEAEAFLYDLGFNAIRVRWYDGLARIEVGPDEIDRLCSPEVRNKVHKALVGFGFCHVAADLKGYRTGSLNEGLDLPQNG